MKIWHKRWIKETISKIKCDKIGEEELDYLKLILNRYLTQLPQNPIPHQCYYYQKYRSKKWGIVHASYGYLISLTAPKLYFIHFFKPGLDCDLELHNEGKISVRSRRDGKDYTTILIDATMRIDRINYEDLA